MPSCSLLWWVVHLQFSWGCRVSVCAASRRVARLVMDEEVVIHTVVVGGLLCFLCVQLDAVLQLCIHPLDSGELHVRYCGFGFRGVVGDDPVELEWYRSLEHRFLDFWFPNQAPDFICWRRGRAPSSVLYYGVLRVPFG